MRRKGPEASLDPVLSSTFMDRFLAAVFTTRRGSTCRDVALRNFGTGCITLDCHSSHLSSTSALLWSWPPTSPPGVADRWVLWGSPRTAELLQRDVPGIGLAPAPGNRILNIAWKRIQLLLPLLPHLPAPLLLLVAAHPLHLRPRGCFLQHWKVREVSASPQLQLPGFNLRFGILLNIIILRKNFIQCVVICVVLKKSFYIFREVGG